MPAVVGPTGQTDITDYTDESAARNQQTVAMAPDLVELDQKLFVIGNEAKLPFGSPVFL